MLAKTKIKSNAHMNDLFSIGNRKNQHPWGYEKSTCSLWYDEPL